MLHYHRFPFKTHLPTPLAAFLLSLGCTDNCVPGSPYVTSVGATQWAGDEEVACSIATGAIITSGGGFSNINAAPEYQKDAIAKWVKNAKVQQPELFETEFNTSKRGFPDIAVSGHK